MLGGYLSEIFVSFQGEGTQVGRRHLFVRLAGCNLRCRYCDTPDSLERVPYFRVRETSGGEREVANPISVEDLLAQVATLLRTEPHVDGVALTGGEPLLQAPFLSQVLGSPVLPRPRLLETNGMLPDQLRLVLPEIDMVSMDCKLPSNSHERPFWEEHGQFLALARGKVYVKILVDQSTRTAEMERAIDLIGRNAPEAPVILQPITRPDGRMDVDPDLLRRFFAVARTRLEDVRLLPQTHKVLGIA